MLTAEQRLIQIIGTHVITICSLQEQIDKMQKIIDELQTKSAGDINLTGGGAGVVGSATAGGTDGT